jgi:hypothetical protein
LVFWLVGGERQAKNKDWCCARITPVGPPHLHARDDRVVGLLDVDALLDEVLEVLRLRFGLFAFWLLRIEMGVKLCVLIAGCFLK